MTEWLAAHLPETIILAGLGGASLIQISPLKLNPWTWLGNAIGRFIGVTAVSEKLDAHIKLDDERNIKQCRLRILRFNDEILQGRPHTKEHYDEILDDITEYERYCEAHPRYKNSKAGMAIRVVESKYQRHMENKTFLKSGEEKEETHI